MKRASKISTKALSIRLDQSSVDDVLNGLPNVDTGVVWERLSIGYRIVDLGKDRFDEAFALVKVFAIITSVWKKPARIHRSYFLPQNRCAGPRFSPMIKYP